MKTINILIALFAASLICADAHAFTAEGFANPFGVAVDAKAGFIYVSNVNGDPNAKDDNGYISRLKGDGTVDRMRFIDGASDKIELSAPAGMAVAEGRLYVADITNLHAFELASGKPLFDVNFGDLPVQHFYDVTMGPDGALYLADGPANTIYRIDLTRQHEVTTFMTGDDLGQPHGIVWFPGRQVFAVAGWSSGQVTAYDRAGKRQTIPAIMLRTLQGITADEAGNMFVASEGLAAVYRIAANFALDTFKLAFTSPAGLAYNPVGNEVVAASFDAGRVESIPVAGDGERVKAAVVDTVPIVPRPRPEEVAPVKEEEATAAEGEEAGGEEAKAEEPEKTPEKVEKPEEKPEEKPQAEPEGKPEEEPAEEGP